MKKTILALSLFLSLNVFSQTTETSLTSQSSDSIKVVAISKELNDYFSSMSSWTPEEIEYFKNNFVHTRGNFTVPKRPTELPKKNN